MTNNASSTVKSAPQRSRGNHLAESGNLFGEASRVARKGRYAEALEILEKAVEAGDCPEEMAWDLKARIYAQQGMYLHAESCWMNAQRLNGLNPAYADALVRIRRTRLPNWHLRGLTSILLLVAILSVLVWQIVIVNRTISQYGAASAQRFVAIQNEMENAREADRIRDAAQANRMQATDRSLDKISAILSDRLGPTSKDNPIVQQVNKKLMEVEQNVSRRLTALESLSKRKPRLTIRHTRVRSK